MSIKTHLWLLGEDKIRLLSYKAVPWFLLCAYSKVVASRARQVTGRMQCYEMVRWLQGNIRNN